MSEELNLMPPLDEGADNLNDLLQQQAPQKRSKLTTALVIVLVLLVGVLVGVPLGRASATLTGAGRPSGFPGADQAGSPGSSTSTAPQLPMGAGPGGGRGTSGTVEKVDGSTITVTTQQGQTVTVTTTDQTQVTESRQVGVDALQPGTSVMVIGQTGDDGSIAADRIIAGDASFGAPGMGAPGGARPAASAPTP